jgi:hypothetical protein
MCACAVAMQRLHVGLNIEIAFGEKNKAVIDTCICMYACMNACEHALSLSLSLHTHTHTQVHVYMTIPRDPRLFVWRRCHAHWREAWNHSAQEVRRCSCGRMRWIPGRLRMYMYTKTHKQVHVCTCTCTLLAMHSGDAPAKTWFAFIKILSAYTPLENVQMHTSTCMNAHAYTNTQQMHVHPCSIFGIHEWTHIRACIHRSEFYFVSPLEPPTPTPLRLVSIQTTQMNYVHVCICPWLQTLTYMSQIITCMHTYIRLHRRIPCLYDSRARTLNRIVSGSEDTHEPVYVCMCTCMPPCVLYGYVFVCMCMYVCMCICIYIHTHS